MAQISANPHLIKAALLRGLRVGIILRHDETLAEYHFIKDPRSLPDILETVVCVMCTSTTSDPLLLYGTSRPLKEFLNLMEKQVMYANYSPYQRTDVRLYPGDWYPCFETEHEKKISKVRELLPSLQSISEKIAADDKLQTEAELKRFEEEKKRREEEFRNLEEARKNRSNLSHGSLIIDRTRLLGRRLPSVVGPQPMLNLRDEMNIVSGGFFSSL